VVVAGLEFGHAISPLYDSRRDRARWLGARLVARPLAVGDAGRSAAGADSSTAAASRRRWQIRFHHVQLSLSEEFQKENCGAWSSSPIAESAVESLAKLVSSPKEATRHHAAWLLGGLGSKKRPLAFDPVPALLAGINDPSSRVRGESFYALGNFGSAAAAALPALRKRMTQDQSHDAFMAALAVKEIDPQTDIGPRLRELFLAGDKHVWRSVATQLPAHLPPAEARQLLNAKSQAETDTQAREILAMALNKIKE
jgi:HEAT repeat protein